MVRVCRKYPLSPLRRPTARNLGLPLTRIANDRSVLPFWACDFQGGAHKLNFLANNSSATATI